MNIIFKVLIFCIVLFLYLHIYHQLKTSEDLEVYEIDNPSKDKLEEICDIRQPVIFQYNNTRIMDRCSLTNIVEQYGAFDVKIRNSISPLDEKQDRELFFPIRSKDAVELFRKGTDDNYVSENNEDFLKETNIIKTLKYNDGFLRPHMVSNCNYDLVFGSKNTTTPLRYHMNYRNYFLVTSGSITIKMFKPSSAKYLSTEKDYDNFEFISPVDVWDVQDIYKNDFDKVKSLEVTLEEGSIIYIPAYWLYSVKFNTLSSICSFEYRTYMNTIAITPHIILYLLQRSNITHKTHKIHNVDNNEVEQKEVRMEQEEQIVEQE